MKFKRTYHSILGDEHTMIYAYEPMGEFDSSVLWLEFKYNARDREITMKANKLNRLDEEDFNKIMNENSYEISELIRKVELDLAESVVFKKKWER